MAGTLDFVIEAVVFDMDGVLIDSEPIWQDVEIDVFASVGLHFTRQTIQQTMGLRLDEAVRYRFHQQPWTGPTVEMIEMTILDRMEAAILERGTAIPGALGAIELAQARGLRLGVATSSPWRLLNATLDRLGIRGAFHAVQSAEHLERGKPHPDVYLEAASGLGVRPSVCLAIEDSLNGAKSAVAAGMQCLSVPESYPHHDPEMDRISVRVARHLSADLLREALESAAVPR